MWVFTIFAFEALLTRLILLWVSMLGYFSFYKFFINIAQKIDQRCSQDWYPVYFQFKGTWVFTHFASEALIVRLNIDDHKIEIALSFNVRCCLAYCLLACCLASCCLIVCCFACWLAYCFASWLKYCLASCLVYWIAFSKCVSVGLNSIVLFMNTN